MTKLQTRLIPDKIRIVDFKMVKGAVESPFEFDQSKIEGHSFQVSYDMGFNFEDKFVKADFEVEIITESKNNQGGEAKGIFHFVFVYHIDNLEELVIPKTKKNKLEISGELGNALASITYSTSRGILMTRFQGTALNDFILPVIDPNQLLETSEVL